jgi:hypothetical protein
MLTIVQVNTIFFTPKLLVVNMVIDYEKIVSIVTYPKQLKNV